MSHNEGTNEFSCRRTGGPNNHNKKSHTNCTLCILDRIKQNSAMSFRAIIIAQSHICPNNIARFAEQILQILPSNSKGELRIATNMRPFRSKAAQTKPQHLRCPQRVAELWSPSVIDACHLLFHAAAAASPSGSASFHCRLSTTRRYLRHRRPPVPKTRTSRQLRKLAAKYYVTTVPSTRFPWSLPYLSL